MSSWTSVISSFYEDKESETETPKLKAFIKARSIYNNYELAARTDRLPDERFKFNID